MCSIMLACSASTRSEDFIYIYTSERCKSFVSDSVSTVVSSLDGVEGPANAYDPTTTFGGLSFSDASLIARRERTLGRLEPLFC